MPTIMMNVPSERVRTRVFHGSGPAIGSDVLRMPRPYAGSEGLGSGLCGRCHPSAARRGRPPTSIALAPGPAPPRTRRAHPHRLLAVLAIGALAAGGLHLALAPSRAGDNVWRRAVVVLATELAFEVARTVVVDHHMGVDTIALVAMVGSLALGEELAGLIVGLMFSGGAALEDVASTRARRELTALVQRAPKVAQRRVGDRLEEVPVEQVQVGDVVVVRTGEVVPVDGTVVERRGRRRHEHAERRAAAGDDRRAACRC